MDLNYHQGEGLSVEEKLTNLARRQDEIRHIIRRRQPHIEAIDWTAMTEQEQDWSLAHYPELLKEELWEIDVEIHDILDPEWKW